MLSPTARHLLQAHRYRPQSAVFDGSADYAPRGAALTGIADGKQGTLSFWLAMAADGGGGRILTTPFASGATRFNCVKISAGNVVRLELRNAAGTLILQITSVATFTVAAGLRHWLCSWDLAQTTAHLYVDDASSATIATGPTDDTIDYAGPTNWTIGGFEGGTSLIGGSLAELWFHPTYMNITDPLIRRRFIAYRRPVNLGLDGERVLGMRPLIYCSLPRGRSHTNADAFVTNRGTGGGFTINGALAFGAAPGG